MQITLKQFKKAARTTRLTAAEKTTMREALVRHVKAHPAQGEAHPSYGVIPSPFMPFLKGKRAVSFGVTVGILLGGGTMSFAAESTVPGDLLYPVKIHMNETVRGAIAVTPKAKALWDVTLVERRLQEVEKIAQDPEASPEVRVDARSNMEEYTERVKEHIARFEEEDDDEDARLVAEHLSVILDAHEYDRPSVEGNRQSFAGELAATSTVSVEPSVREALNKVRETREHASEKHQEIKKKQQLKKDESREREKEEAEEEKTSSVSPSTIVNTGAPESFPQNRLGEKAKNGNKARERKEELRAIPESAASEERSKEKKEEKRKGEEKEEDRDD